MRESVVFPVLICIPEAEANPASIHSGPSNTQMEK